MQTVLLLAATINSAAEYNPPPTILDSKLVAGWQLTRLKTLLNTSSLTLICFFHKPSIDSRLWIIY